MEQNIRFIKSSALKKCSFSLLLYLWNKEDYMKFKIILEPSEDGGFTVSVPALPGCISEGDSREEAIHTY
jgi:hypothetical protein